MPTFITDEVKALFREQHGKGETDAHEIAAFLDDNHIKEVCERVKEAVVDQYLRTGDKITYVQVDDPLSTQAVAMSEECHNTLLAALKSLEDSTENVVLRGGREPVPWRASMDGHIAVYFSWK